MLHVVVGEGGRGREGGGVYTLMSLKLAIFLNYYTLTKTMHVIIPISVCVCYYLELCSAGTIQRECNILPSKVIYIL